MNCLKFKITYLLYGYSKYILYCGKILHLSNYNKYYQEKIEIEVCKSNSYCCLK